MKSGKAPALGFRLLALGLALPDLEMNVSDNAKAFEQTLRDDPQLASIATHEAAHAVCGQAYGRPAMLATIDPDDECLGSVWCGPNLSNPYMLRGQMIGLSAGRIAQDRLGVGAGSDANDRLRMREIALRLVGVLGAPEHVRQEIVNADGRAAVLVRQYWSQIIEVAGALIRYRTLIHGLEIRQFPPLAELDAARGQRDVDAINECCEAGNGSACRAETTGDQAD